MPYCGSWQESSIFSQLHPEAITEHRDAAASLDARKARLIFYADPKAAAGSPQPEA